MTKKEIADYERKQRLTDSILSKIEFLKGKRLNKSYALIKFKYIEDKQKAMSQDLRLFGLRIGQHMSRMDDADYKTSIILQNIQWGCKLQHLMDFINE